jgi:RHS repeat-associated protein
MQAEHRSWSSGDWYRFGFNGQEKDNEVAGEGNSYDFGARIYDSRLGRWMSTDPLQQNYPGMSPYNFVGNMPIIAVDPDGQRIRIKGTRQYRRQVKVAIAIMRQTDAGNQVYKALKRSSHLVIIAEMNDEQKDQFHSKYRGENSRPHTDVGEAHYEDGVGDGMPWANTLMIGGDLISKDPFAFAHELFHSYVDLVQFDDNDEALAKNYKDFGTWDVQENQAMAFENYIRTIYGDDIRYDYGYVEANPETIASYDNNLKEEFGVTDINSRIKILNYGYSAETITGSGLDNYSSTQTFTDTGIMEFNISESGESLDFVTKKFNINSDFKPKKE